MQSSVLYTKLHPLTKLVLGLSWLRAEDPLIDWKTLTVAPCHAPALGSVGHDLVPTFTSIPELYLQDPIQVVPPHTPTSGLSPMDLESIHDYDSLMATLCFALPFHPSDPVAWPPLVEEVEDEFFEEDIYADMPDLWPDDSLSDIDDEDPVYADKTQRQISWRGFLCSVNEARQLLGIHFYCRPRARSPAQGASSHCSSRGLEF